MTRSVYSYVLFLLLASASESKPSHGIGLQALDNSTDAVGVARRQTILCTPTVDATGTNYICNDRDYTEVPPTVWIDATTAIYLYDNAISFIPVNAFDGLLLLRYLYLNFNAITSVPVGMLDNNPALLYLNLQGNAITLIPVGLVDNNPALERLALNNNAITSVPVGMVDNNPALEYLILSGNPLFCVGFAQFEWEPGTAISSICTTCTVGMPQTATCGSLQIEFLQCGPECVSEPNSESPTVPPTAVPTASKRGKKSKKGKKSKSPKKGKKQAKGKKSKAKNPK